MIKLYCSAVAHQGLHSQTVIQNALAKAQALRGHFQKLIICQKLETLFQAQDSRRDQTQGFIRTGRTGIGQVLGPAHIDRHIFRFRADGRPVMPGEGE